MLGDIGQSGGSEMRVIAASITAIGLSFSAAFAGENISKSTNPTMLAANSLGDTIQQAHRNAARELQNDLEAGRQDQERTLSRRELRLALIALLRESKLLTALAQ
jgi:hypothetical protein